MFSIGTFADWFGVGVMDGIKASQECGASGVQLSAWETLHPNTITEKGISELKARLKECSQVTTALCGMLDGHGFERREDNEEKIDYIKKTILLAQAVDCNIVTTHIGRIPEDKSSERYLSMLEACKEIGSYAASQDAYLAVETGPESVERLMSFIADCGVGIGVNYDPANLIMVTNVDEVASVYTAGNAIVHTHAKDGIMHLYRGPEEIYEIFATGGIEALNMMHTYFEETPLGNGSVRWDAYLAALSDIGYAGYLTIERESGESGDDIRRAVEFLQEKLALN